MGSRESYHRFVVIAISILVIFTPIVILGLTIGFLLLTEDLRLGRLSLLEYLELYIIDLIVVSAVAYGIYRLTLRLVEDQLPASLDAIDSADEGDEAEDKTANLTEDRDSDEVNRDF